MYGPAQHLSNNYKRGQPADPCSNVGIGQEDSKTDCEDEEVVLVLVVRVQPVKGCGCERVGNACQHEGCRRRIPNEVWDLELPFMDIQ